MDTTFAFFNADARTWMADRARSARPARSRRPRMTFAALFALLG